MITHYQITLLPEHETRIFPEWGYHLYSSLLSLTPHGFGERMHSNGITPLSSCITVQDKQVIWHVNLLGADSEAVLTRSLSSRTATGCVEKTNHCMSTRCRLSILIRRTRCCSCPSTAQ